MKNKSYHTFVPMLDGKTCSTCGLSKPNQTHKSHKTITKQSECRVPELTLRAYCSQSIFELENIHDRLARVGMIKTYQQVSKVLQMIGWELAEKLGDTYGTKSENEGEDER